MVSKLKVLLIITKEIVLIYEVDLNIVAQFVIDLQKKDQLTIGTGQRQRLCQLFFFCL